MEVRAVRRTVALDHDRSAPKRVPDEVADGVLSVELDTWPDEGKAPRDLGGDAELGVIESAQMLSDALALAVRGLGTNRIRRAGEGLVDAAQIRRLSSIYSPGARQD